MEELYLVFRRGVRFKLCRSLGPAELDDRVHDSYLIVVGAIQRGEIRQPERLVGFIRTVVRRQLASYVETATKQRNEFDDADRHHLLPDRVSNPEQSAIHRERVPVMRGALREMSDREREILERFYILEQPAKDICLEMGLTATQFRLQKSRAKARFGGLARRTLAIRALSNKYLRAEQY